MRVKAKPPQRVGENTLATGPLLPWLPRPNALYRLSTNRAMVKIANRARLQQSNQKLIDRQPNARQFRKPNRAPPRNNERLHKTAEVQLNYKSPFLLSAHRFFIHARKPISV
jgi:hypothetical protein